MVNSLPIRDSLHLRGPIWRGIVVDQVVNPESRLDKIKLLVARGRDNRSRPRGLGQKQGSYGNAASPLTISLKN